MSQNQNNHNHHHNSHHNNHHSNDRQSASSSAAAAAEHAAAGPSNRPAAGSSSAASSSFYHDADDVRPPIAPVRQILNPSPIGYPAPDLHQGRRYNTRAGPVSDVYDAFRDFQAEAQWQEAAQEQGAEQANSEASQQINRGRTLQELFRPPLDVMFRGSNASARECGSLQNKWLLVNIQNGREFACQILNRDVWSNQTVKDILKEHFIFWQVYHDSYEGQRYVAFYHVSSFPHVAIIDPRTGELMKSWPTAIDHNYFCDSVIEFLTEHPSPDGSGDANTMKKLRVKEENDELTTLYDQSEEAQLEAAIKASLQESHKVHNIDDTIEIDEDTIEALDIPDQQQIARDRELIERSPTRETSKLKLEKTTCPNNKSSPNSKPQTSEPKLSSVDANHKTRNEPKPEPETDNRTSAEILRELIEQRPQKIEGPECRIALRFPDGSSLVQKFSALERLAAVKQFVQLGKTAANASSIEFIAPPNRKLAESKMDQTLEDLGLCPASRLEVKCVQED